MKSALLFLLFGAALAFAADPVTQAVYPIWNVPNLAVAADFDGDGNLDRAELNAANTLTIMLGSAPLGEIPGTGLKEQSFRFKASYQTGMAPRSVRAADLNGDGKLDLVVANHGSNDVNIFAGKGDGTFKAAGIYSAGTGPLCVAVTDLNSDGKLDLVVSNDIDAEVRILLGKGDGTFPRAVSVKTRPQADSIAVADFNHDGKADLAVASSAQAATNSISVLFGRGDGTFENVVDFVGIRGPQGIVIGQQIPGTR